MRIGDLRTPIVLAPMAGGPSTVALAAAVSEAGGLGFLAAGYRAPDDVQREIRALRSRTELPFGVNLFVPAAEASPPAALPAYLERLRATACRYGAELGRPRHDDDGWAAKLAVLRRERPPVVSFAFGCPPPGEVAALQAAGVAVWVTVSDPLEAPVAQAAGADALVVQGAEAGGHRGGFDDGDQEPIGLLALLRLVASACDLPLVAAGGIADGAALAATLTAGAAAAQLGSAFLLADEAGTHPAHRAALVRPAATALTRAFSGRRARGIVNGFMREHSAPAPSAYPRVHHATAPLRAAARAQNDGDGFNLWAGQAHSLARALPAAEIVASIDAEARAALSGAAALLNSRAVRTSAGRRPERGA
ncbi:MAG: nitronate monooxygenase [Solirubrobacteraceae bacterium]